MNALQFSPKIHWSINKCILVQRLRLQVGIRCKRNEWWTANIKDESYFDWNLYWFAIWIFSVNSSENVNIFFLSFFFSISVRKFDPNCGCACCDWLYTYFFSFFLFGVEHTSTRTRTQTIDKIVWWSKNLNGEFVRKSTITIYISTFNNHQQL